MNIFVVDNDPIISAKMLCNKHVVKMIVESLQILSDCHPQELVQYKRTHYNHPCCIWARESIENYNWLYSHNLALCKEYTRRYNKIHKCESILLSLPAPDLPQIPLTPFAQAMSEQYREVDAVVAYRNYYISDKAYMCKWMSEQDIPHFFKNFILINNINPNNYIRGTK